MENIFRLIYLLWPNCQTRGDPDTCRIICFIHHSSDFIIHWYCMDIDSCFHFLLGAMSWPTIVHTMNCTARNTIRLKHHLQNSLPTSCTHNYCFHEWFVWFVMADPSNGWNILDTIYIHTDPMKNKLKWLIFPLRRLYMQSIDEKFGEHATHLSYLRQFTPSPVHLLCKREVIKRWSIYAVVRNTGR